MISAQIDISLYMKSNIGGAKTEKPYEIRSERGKSRGGGVSEKDLRCRPVFTVLNH